MINKKIGEVKFNVSEMVHNPYYRFRDYDATFLNVGTEIYSLRSESNAVAAKIGEQYFLYKVN